MRAFPDRVALGSLSTELGEVKMCLNACRLDHQYDLVATRMNSPERAGNFETGHSMGHPRRIENLDTKILATGRQIRVMCRSEVAPLF
jgi:hypothetical protein